VCDSANSTTKLHNETALKDSHPTTYEWLDFMKPLHGDFPRILEEEDDDGNENNMRTRIHTAVCVIKDTANLPHFPHVMQRFLPCWSLWEHLPKNVTRIMLFAKGWKRYDFQLKASFNQGLFQLMKSQNISIVDSPNIDAYIRSHNDSGTLFVERLKPNNNEARGAKDIQSLKRVTVDWMELRKNQTQSCLSVEVGSSGGGGGDNMAKPFPRIGIINRHGPRKLLDSSRISVALQLHFGLPYKPPVFYFEEFTFEQQVEAMASVDVLLSPHGAQLTGVVFMPRCGSVIEVLPHGYGRPAFFGTLAALSGLGHSYIYIGRNMTAETAKWSQRRKMRDFARGQDVCVSQDNIMRMVEVELGSWKQCCGVVAMNDDR